MHTTPQANRVHLTLYGKVNAGKSSLLNAIIGQEISIVSPHAGTTTDPISKSMELLPFGPVVFTDTAGLSDLSALGTLRMERSRKTLQRTDFALYIIDASTSDDEEYERYRETFRRFNIPHHLVFSKIDLARPDILEKLKVKYPEASFVSHNKPQTVFELKDTLISRLDTLESDPPLIGDLLPYGSTTLLVVPIDSEAPKGRLILPQVQLIRDCLDNGIKTLTVRDTELAQALQDLGPNIDLVVTDSQAFKAVDKMVPQSIPLTSFSILFARQKGDLEAFTSGITALRGLNSGSRILISESCTHNHSHEDIGRYKIPAMIRKRLGIDPEFVFRMGHDFPEDLSSYDLVIHCGSCMLNRKTMRSRIGLCNEAQTPITNYGIVLAELTGILSRSLEIFR